MKNTILTIALCLAAFAAATAQGGFIRLQGGFGFAATNDVAGISISKDTNKVIVSRKNLYGTSGMGPTVRLAGGYMINKHFGVELQLYYMIGMYHPISETVDTLTASSPIYSITRERSRQLRGVLSVTVDAGLEKVSPYARFGMLLPLAGKTTQYAETWYPATGVRRENVLDAYGAFSVGFEASAGVNIKLAKGLTLQAELYYAGLRIKSDRAETSRNQEFDADGNLTADFLDANMDGVKDAAIWQTQFNFVDELTPESNTFGSATFDLEKPTDVLAQRGNYSSFGINVGVQYLFGGKKASE